MRLHVVGQHGALQVVVHGALVAVVREVPTIPRLLELAVVLLRRRVLVQILLLLLAVVAPGRGVVTLVVAGHLLQCGRDQLLPREYLTVLGHYYQLVQDLRVLLQLQSLYLVMVFGYEIKEYAIPVVMVDVRPVQVIGEELPYVL